MEQINLFGGTEPIKINKKIRLIETFAGIGAQAKALENIGADFEHYRICEFDKYAVTAYNAIHGTNFPVSDITKWTAADMGIEEKDKYEYIVTYSFPCQSLSISGKQAGMAKGSGTRSGLLWEVERLLEECNGNLPQILLMENVDAILFEKNRKHFFQWCNRLEEFGYKNYYQVLNAKDYGIPQNRNRCFMVSILGDYYFEFPKPIKLELCVKDMLEKEVPEKYYISTDRVKELLNKEYDGRKGTLPDSGETLVSNALGSRDGINSGRKEICPTLAARDYKDPKVICQPCLTPGRLEKRQNGRRFKENGDPMFTLTAQDIHGVAILQPTRTDYGKAVRKQYETGEIKESRHNMTKLEPRTDGISNTLTTIQKDNLLMVPNEMAISNPDIKQLGNISDSESYGGNPQTGRVYDPEYICPAINTMQGGQREPKFLVEEMVIGGMQEHQSIKTDGIVPGLTAAMGMGGGYVPMVVEEDVTPCEIRHDEGIRTYEDNIMGTLRTIDKCGDKYIIESKPAFGRAGKQACEALNENECCEGDTINPFNKTVDKSGTSPSLTTRPEGFKTAIFPVEKTQLGNFRIRKLLPIECFLLQGFTREDFFKVKQVGISDCQCYKQSGNSICVPVLEAIFRNMNMKGIDRWDK